MLIIWLLLVGSGQGKRKLFFWQVAPEIHSFRLNDAGPAEDDEVEDGVPTFVEWELPSKSASN